MEADQVKYNYNLLAVILKRALSQYYHFPVFKKSFSNNKLHYKFIWKKTRSKKTARRFKY